MNSLRIGLVVALISSPSFAWKKEVSSTGKQLVWTFDIANAVKEPTDWIATDHKTQEVAFSPDGRRIAVTLTHDQGVPHRNLLFNTHLLIVDVEKPESDVREFDLVQTCGVDLTWNERGDAIHVCGVLVQLGDGASCRIDSPPDGYPLLSREYAPHRSFWMDADRLIRNNGEVMDLNCRHVADWPLAPSWRIEGVDVSHGWALLGHTEGFGAKAVCDSSFVDLASHQMLPGWLAPKLSCFADALDSDVSAVCSGAYTNLRCYEVKGGSEIPIPKQFRRYSLTGVASHSSRVIAEKWESERIPWWWWLIPMTYLGDDPGTPPLPRERTVFDLRDGKVIASWIPRIQRSLTSPHVEDRPFHAALSGDGQFVAESGDGVLELYRMDVSRTAIPNTQK